MTRRIAHISDLHFGREDSGIASALAKDLHAVGVDLVLVSGDLTQRARRKQFAAARRWLDSLQLPWLAVPGNHDIPLFDVVRRAVDPFGRHRAFICETLEPQHLDEEVAVFGLNSVLPRVWKGGIVRGRSIQRLRTWSRQAGDRCRIVVAHHPFRSKHEPARSGEQAILALEEAGVDVLLTGHLHRFAHGESREVVVGGPRRLLVVGASTAISHRRRGEANGYNLLEVDAGHILVECRRFQDGAFATASQHAYRRLPPHASHEQGPTPPASAAQVEASLAAAGPAPGRTHGAGVPPRQPLSRSKPRRRT